LPLPTRVDLPGLSVHDAMDAGMLLHIDDEKQELSLIYFILKIRYRGISFLSLDLLIYSSHIPDISV
jgi:hypothetical protein